MSRESLLGNMTAPQRAAFAAPWLECPSEPLRPREVVPGLYVGLSVNH